MIHAFRVIAEKLEGNARRLRHKPRHRPAAGRRYRRARVQIVLGEADVLLLDDRHLRRIVPVHHAAAGDILICALGRFDVDRDEIALFLREGDLRLRRIDVFLLDQVGLVHPAGNEFADAQQAVPEGQHHRQPQRQQRIRETHLHAEGQEPDAFSATQHQPELLFSRQQNSQQKQTGYARRRNQDMQDDRAGKLL